jgi:hypothetical protein
VIETITSDKVNKTIEKYEIEISQKPKDSMDKLFKELDLSISEIVFYQNLKSIAQLENKIDFETAMLLYHALGSWNKTTLAERITYNLIFTMIKQ